MKFFLNGSFLLILAGCANSLTAQSYLKGDFHQHTTYTDGSFSIDHVMKMNKKYGLDWWANSEHGGPSLINARVSGRENANAKMVYWDEYAPSIILGTERYEKGHRVMWRWQVLRDSSFAQVLKNRKRFPEQTILQSYEMNVPGHEHASLGIIKHQFSSTPHCTPLAEFEYKFDERDLDTIGGASQGWKKSLLKGHPKALESLSWLKSNYPTTSYFIVAHPERKPQLHRGYSIADFRDFNNVAPDICFGFEGVPGHQREAQRGGFDSLSIGGGTYGGTGIFTAKVGGLWDALLTEGRHFWLFSNSDYHNQEAEFYPGEYQKNYSYTEGKSAQQILNGLRSGNNWVVTGDLIDSLIFSVKPVNKSSRIQASMGQELVVTAGQTVEIIVKVRDPQSINHNIYSSYRNPQLNHIDIIQGEVHSKVDPHSALYRVDTVNTTRVLARFDSRGGTIDANGMVSKRWVKKPGGWREMTYTIQAKHSMYFRLRGTNQAVSTAGETDNCGNPMLDVLGSNSAEKAFSDLWFYSNPIYVLSSAQ